MIDVVRFLLVLALVTSGCAPDSASSDILFREGFDDEEGSATLGGVNTGWMLLIDQEIGEPPPSAYFTATVRETAGVMPGGISTPVAHVAPRLVASVDLRPEGIGVDPDPVAAGLERGVSELFGARIVAGSNATITFVTPNDWTDPQPLDTGSFQELQIVVTDDGRVSIRFEGDEKLAVQLDSLAPDDEWRFAMHDAQPTGAVWTDNIVLAK